MRRSAVVAAVSIAMASAGCTSSSSSGERSPVEAHEVHAIVTIVHQHLATQQVDLYAIPDGYEPRVQAERALSLGLAQLSDPARISSAHLYLGEFWVHGTSESAIPAWVMVVGPSRNWCPPSSGAAPGQASANGAEPSAVACYFGVVINADTGDFVVEG
jgi:hypothetical protein